MNIPEWTLSIPAKKLEILFKITHHGGSEYRFMTLVTCTDDLWQNKSFIFLKLTISRSNMLQGLVYIYKPPTRGRERLVFSPEGCPKGAASS